MDRFSPRVVLVVVAVVLVAIWGVILAVAPWSSADTARAAIASVPPPAGADPALDVEVTIEGVDAVQERMRVRVRTFVLDARRAGDDWLVVTSMPGKPILRPDTDPITVPVADDVPITGGGIDDYPWDGYVTGLVFAGGHENTEDIDASTPDLPVQLRVTSTAYGFEFTPLQVGDVPGAQSAPAATGLLLRIGRGNATLGWAQVMMLLYWLIAAGVVAVAVAVVTRWRRFESSRQLAWISATLFALVAFRNAAPGGPPIGVFFDWAAYFWAVGLVAAALLALVAFDLLDRSADLRTPRGGGLRRSPGDDGTP